MLKIIFHALSTLFTGARLQCPHCKSSKMFRNRLEIYKNCPECDVLLQPYPGDILGVVAVGYFMTLIPVFAFLIWLYLNYELSPWGYLGAYWVMTTIILLAIYPHAKGIWVGFVYLITNGFSEKPNLH